MRLLDLFCGAGLAADGWMAAGFDVVGVDNVDQPHYPTTFYKGDALALLAGAHDDWVETFDLITGSPPCQMHTRAKHLRAAQGGESKYPDLLTPTLALLRQRWRHKTWVVENVPGAPGMDGAITLCGSMFGLEVQRHRLFLSNVPLEQRTCDHSTFPLDPRTGKPRPWGVYHVPGDSIPAGGRTCRDATHAATCMGVRRHLPWQGLKEGYPPAYSYFLGLQLRAVAEVAA